MLLLPLNHNACFLASPKREIRCPGERRDARNAADAFTRLLVELFGAGLVVAGLAGIEHEKSEVICIEAGINGVFALYASENQCRHDQQDERNRDLAGEERVGQADPVAAPACGACFFLENFGDRGARSPESRHDAEKQASENGNYERKTEHIHVDAEISQVLSKFRRTERPEKLASSITQQDPENAAKKAKQNTFGQELTNQADATGAKRDANGDFLAANGGAR